MQLKKPHIAFTLKTYVAVALSISLGLLTLIILIGLLVPKETLLKLSGNKNTEESTLAQGTVENKDGTVVENDTENETEAENGAQTPAEAPGTPTSPGTPAAPTTTPGATPGATGVAPSLTFSASPTSVTAGASSTLSWSVANGATGTVSCTAGGGWSGAKATSGSQAVTISATTSFTLVCTNSVGSSGTKTVTVTASAPASACGAGGTCSAADIASHNTNGNCWVGVTGTGFNKVYVITSSFNSSHVSSTGKNAASSARTCGKVISITTLRGFDGNHSDGAKIGGSTFDTWLASFYYANYQ